MSIKSVPVKTLIEMINENVGYCKADLQFALDFCFLQKSTTNVAADLYVDVYIPLNDHKRTNISHALPLIIMPMQVTLSYTVCGRYSIYGIKSLITQNKKDAADLLYCIKLDGDFDLESILTKAIRRMEFRVALFDSISAQIPETFTNTCIETLMK